MGGVDDGDAGAEGIGEGVFEIAVDFATNEEADVAYGAAGYVAVAVDGCEFSSLRLILVERKNVRGEKHVGRFISRASRRDIRRLVIDECADAGGVQRVAATIEKREGNAAVLIVKQRLAVDAFGLFDLSSKKKHVRESHEIFPLMTRRSR